MADIAIFRINYKSDFILTLNSDAGWMTPFCIKFWTGAPSQAYFASYDGTTYTHCAPVEDEPTKLRVQFDDHHLPIGDLKFQIGYHFTVADFPTTVEDEVLNQASVIIEVDGEPAQVMLDFNGETAPEIEFSLPAYANEAQRIANEQQRIENEQARISAENERISNEDARIAEEQVRVSQEAARVSEFAELKADAQEATEDANAAAELANEKAAEAQQKATYAQTQGNYAKAQGDIAQADHQRAESDHTTATADHTQADTDHNRAESDHTRAESDHNRAESDHTRAESDHEAVEVYVDSLGAFDISAYHATGGVLAKYADLAAALGTGGANIPDDLRKGGMSVKFVQSSDNTYVEYFLTKNSWSADVRDWEKLNLEDEINQLYSEINGSPEVAIQKSDYALQPGLDMTGTFMSNSVYGTKNKYVLVPMTEYIGRTVDFTVVSGHYSSEIAFLKTETLVSGDPMPYCNSTTGIYTTGRYVVPSDCVCMYIYAEREGADSFPVVKIVEEPGSVCTSERASLIEASVSNLGQDIEDVSSHIVVYQINEITGDRTAVYTLSEAISAVPSELRKPGCALLYNTKIQSYYIPKIAFYKGLGVVNWLTTDYWTEVDIRNWSNTSEVAGAYKMQFTNETASGSNKNFGLIPVPFQKMVVYKHSIDNNGRWRILIRYTDGTNEFKDISNGNIVTIVPNTEKTVIGFEYVLMTTSANCSIDADVLIGASETMFGLTYKENPTAESIGAVSSNQGAVNAGKVLAVDNSGNVVPAENTPAGTLIGYGKIESSLKLDLKANTASEVSVGTGWSGSLANGYTHTSGSTNALVLGHTTEGKSYIVTIGFSAVTENSIEVKIGNGYPVDPYNGTLQSIIGFVSDGGDLTIIPASTYTGTITVKLQEVTDSEHSVEEVTININNFDAGLMVSDLTGFWNVAIGPDTQTMGSIVNASRNIGIGRAAMANLESGSRNIGIGTFALAQLKNGKGNIGIGADTYYHCSGGNDNVAIGRASMGAGTTSVNDNVCVGRSAGTNVSGDNNVAVGPVAGYNATSDSVYIGLNTGYNATGVKNIFIGRHSGYTGGSIAGNWNTLVGPSTYFSNNVSKSTAIGYQAAATKSSQNVIGSSDSIETKVYGDLVVHGTDGVDRRIVFNQDNTVSWETVS